MMFDGADTSNPMGNLCYKYLPYMLVSVQGCSIRAEVIKEDGFKPIRKFDSEWIEENIDPEIAPQLFLKCKEFQELTEEEAKNSSGRQKSPSKK